MKPSEDALVRIARVGRPHGLQGEVTLVDSALDAGDLVGVRAFTWRGRVGDPRPLILLSARGGGARLIAQFEGMGHRSHVEPLVNGELWADPAQLPDPGPGVAYAFQIVGLEVRTDDGRALGRVVDVVMAGGGAIYVVRGERELMIPAVPEVVKRVDLEGGVIMVTLPAGLEEL